MRHTVSNFLSFSKSQKENGIFISERNEKAQTKRMRAVNKLQELLDNLKSRFQDFLELKLCFKLFVNPFDINLIFDRCPVCRP